MTDEVTSADVMQALGRIEQKQDDLHEDHVELRAEVKGLRDEIKTAKGGLAVGKWVAGTLVTLAGVLAAFMGLKHS